jgi:LmbE family N-acetylglucosaminyl deacetylase
MTKTPLLAPVAEDWERALAVVAHPDDLEYGAASAVARWTGQGKWVGYVMVTAGEAGIETMPPDECGRVRIDEERNSAAVVGVDTVECLGFPDGLVVADLDLRKAIAGAIRRHRPDVVIGMNHHDMWPGAWNHADHRATGTALLDAARDAANRWLFVGHGGEPWSGVRYALMGASPNPTHFVDVAESIDRGVASLREHQAYLDGLGGDAPDPEAMLRGWAGGSIEQTGCEYAVTFELVGL